MSTVYVQRGPTASAGLGPNATHPLRAANEVGNGRLHPPPIPAGGPNDPELVGVGVGSRGQLSQANT